MIQLACLFLLFSITLVSQHQFANTKKGVGLAESRLIETTEIDKLHIHWYYNWGIESKLEVKIEFVPMVYSKKTIPKISKKTTFLLGFNEPDHTKQANLSAIEAMALWDVITSNATQTISPAIAGNVLKEKNWLDSFIDLNPKIDYIAIHWYKGCDPNKFIEDMSKIILKYKKPLWITEFAPQTVAQSKKEPTKYTQEQINNFIEKTLAWMNAEPMIYRYAWHDSKIGRCALFDSNKQLTETGKAFSKY